MRPDRIVVVTFYGSLLFVLVGRGAWRRMVVRKADGGQEGWLRVGPREGEEDTDSFIWWSVL